MRAICKLAIFTGSFLSFFVQPMVGRTILPVFGGSSTVWVTCLVAFQFLLLAGYGYAFIPSRRGGGIHIALVLLAAGAAASHPWWKGSLLAATGALPPSLGVIVSVLALTGLVSLVLSANSTVVQSWAGGGREVYRLYAIGNVGSFAGLLAYPLLFEPFVGLTAQWLFLGAAMVAYAAMLAGLARGKTRQDAASTDAASTTDRADDLVPRAPWLWVVLPAISCALMTAATAFITNDLVSLPLVWAVLLAVFLLSYVVGFSRIGDRLLAVWTGLAILSLGFAAFAMLPKGNGVSRFGYNFAAVILLLLFVCTALHAWLCRSRPSSDRLPHFYFGIALGGCIGGVLAGVVAPLAFKWVYEYPLMLLVSAASLAYLVWRWTVSQYAALNKTALAVLGAVALVIAVDRGEHDGKEGNLLYRDRGFYGLVAVENKPHCEYAPGEFCDYHIFRHGKTVHGGQLQSDAVRMKPTLYFSLNGGGIPFESHPGRKAGKPVRVAVVGMGMGTLAAYGREGDYFRFYEISPEVIDVATNRTYFSFIPDCKAKVDIVEGDARLKLEEDLKNGVEKFDIFVIDVYSGDSVPTHLVTEEAFRLFKAFLKEDGILAFHISNWHINLFSVMKSAARYLDFNLLETVSGAVLNEYASETYWAFMTKEPFEPRMPNCCQRVKLDYLPDHPLMTDERGSLIFNLHFGYVPPCED